MDEWLLLITISELKLIHNIILRIYNYELICDFNYSSTIVIDLDR